MSFLPSRMDRTGAADRQERAYRGAPLRVVGAKDAAPTTEDDVDSLTRFLSAAQIDADAAERCGPHVVIVRGVTVDRFFGPYPTRERALAVAAAERQQWLLEFPTAEVVFDVAPLIDGRELEQV